MPGFTIKHGVDNADAAAADDTDDDTDDDDHDGGPSEILPP